MALIDGDDFVSGDIDSFQQNNRMKNQWRQADPTNVANLSNPQPGMIVSDSDDEKLYHRQAAAFQEIIQTATPITDDAQIIGGDNSDMILIPYEETTNDAVIWGLPLSPKRGLIFCDVADIAANFTGIITASTHPMISIVDLDIDSYLSFGYAGDDFPDIWSNRVLNLQYEANAGVDLFANSASSETQELRIFGFRAADALRSLEIGVGVDVADTASFDGLSNYYFNGNMGIMVSAPVGRLEVEDAGSASDVIVKITVDDGNPYGLVIGNDTFSVNDLEGLSFLVSDTGVGFIGTNGANTQLEFTTAGALAVRMDTLKNFGIATPTFGTNAEKVFAQLTGVAPTTSPADMFQMYSADVGGVAGEAGAHFRDELGLLTILGDGGAVLDKTSGKGIRVDTATPTFGWRDMLGDVFARNTGASKPTFTTYRDTLLDYQFAVADEEYFKFHIPHDYVEGTDIFLHVHWSHIGALVTGGTITFEYEISYAKGHNQAAFGASVGTTFVGTASVTQYQHIITEVQISAAAPSADQIDSDDLEPDGVIIARLDLNSNNITVSGGGVPDPFIHYVDIHYQSTNIGTKDKVPDFYA